MGGRGSSFGTGSGTDYTSFPDVSDFKGFAYGPGDGSDVAAFFKNNSNYDELINSMDGDDKDSFRGWANGWFMDGQQYNGFDSMTRSEKKMTTTFDRYLDQSTLSKGVILARSSDAQLVLGAGNKTGSLADFQAAEGSIVGSKGCMSFGAASTGLSIGSYRKSVEYKLKIPGGTKGAGMFIGDKRINGWGAEQREFMVNRDTLFKVGKATESRGTITVELTYVGRQAHDYGSAGR